MSFAISYAKAEERRDDKVFFATKAAIRMLIRPSVVVAKDLSKKWSGAIIAICGNSWVY